MRIGEGCTRLVATCSRSTSALDIAQQMSALHVGDVIVVDDKGGQLTPVGVVTDRDLVVKVMAAGIDAGSVQAGDLVGGMVETACESELMHDAVWHLRRKRVRRLPVVDAHGHLIGILTSDDVARFLADELTALNCIATDQAARG